MFDAQPSLDQGGQLSELATCCGIAHGNALLFLGPSSTTHLAVSIGREAIRHIPA